MTNLRPHPSLTLRSVRPSTLIPCDTRLRVNLSNFDTFRLECFFLSHCTSFSSGLEAEALTVWRNLAPRRNVALCCDVVLFQDAALWPDAELWNDAALCHYSLLLDESSLSGTSSLQGEPDRLMIHFSGTGDGRLVPIGELSLG
jgi:hypothetical protein